MVCRLFLESDLAHLFVDSQMVSSIVVIYYILQIEVGNYAVNLTMHTFYSVGSL